MNNEINSSQYYLLRELISRWLDDNSLLENVRRSRVDNEAIGNIVETRFGGDLSLLTSFIVANSNVVYDVEITQESVVTTKYFRYFSCPVTEADVANEFGNNSGDFTLWDRWSEDSEEPECSIEVRRMMVPFEKLQYPNATARSEPLLEAKSGNDLIQKPHSIVSNQSFTANTNYISR